MSDKDLMAGADTDPRVAETPDEDFGDNLPGAEQGATDGGNDNSGNEQPTGTADESQGTDAAGSDEPATDSEPASADGEQQDQQDKQPDHRIPKSRFDEVNQRRKEAERRLQELERQQQAQDPSRAVDFDFDAKEKEYMQAVLDGETDKALEIRKEIRSAETALQEAKVQQAQQEAQYKTKAQLELEQTVTEAQQAYPEFDASSEIYNEEATQEALELFEALKSRGYTPADAMHRSVRLTVSAYGLGQQQQQTQAQTQDRAQSQGRRSQQDQNQGQDREQSQQTLDDKMQTASRQPPTPAQDRESAQLPNKDPMQMSEKEFDALSEEEERRLRGDFV